jgi:hypothetical protein
MSGLLGGDDVKVTFDGMDVTQELSADGLDLSIPVSGLTITRPYELGDLCGHDLGRRLEFTDGGATYRGVLTEVKHSDWPVPLQTWLVLKGEGVASWRHMASHMSDLEVAFLDVEQTITEPVHDD